MPPMAIKVWKFLGLHPNLYLGLILCLEAGAAFVVCLKGHLQPSLIQPLLAVREILATHHVQSTFLPIGYPILIGWAEVLASPRGKAAMDWSVLGMQILVMLLIVFLVRAILAHVTSQRFATTTALIIGLYPQFLTGVNKINDSNVTLAALLLLLLFLVKLRGDATVPKALFVGFALACAVLIRPNTAPMALLLFWPVKRLPLAKAAATVTIAISSAVFVYVCVTGLVHGRPFYPQNGPYNLYAGYNAYTEATLLRELNAEQSILPALAASGVHTQLNWTLQSDVPGVDDSRDERYAPYYVAQTKTYIREHPGTAVRLVLVKSLTMMRQNYAIYAIKDGPIARLRPVAILFKRIALLVIPCWCGLLIYSKWRGLHVGSLVVLSMVVLYVASLHPHECGSKVSHHDRRRCALRHRSDAL